jgi:hypothetical protein
LQNIEVQLTKVGMSDKIAAMRLMKIY